MADERVVVAIDDDTQRDLIAFGVFMLLLTSIEADQAVLDQAPQWATQAYAVADVLLRARSRR